MNKYNIDYISGCMSLRTPQRKSLEILDNILSNIKISKDMDLKSVLSNINSIYPICTDFERDFMSLAFVLATGVGKTRLMGAFVAYLYTNHNIKNFFIVAPNTTIYNKLKQDFGNSSNPKYVFNGLGCFINPPRIITDEDYRNKNLLLFETDINIYIYNISKFNSEKTNMRKMNEILGDSFYNSLSKLDDLVLIMDESHHYHALRSSSSLNDLKPILGLELTATPYYVESSKQNKFKNVVYEYSLSQSIKDGYTRTPYALTQQNIDYYNFGEEELDRVMILDGLKNHENIKKELERYSKNNQKRLVKPFVMIVCKDTEHAEKVYEFVKSNSCKDGIYKDKVLLLHTKLTKANKDANVELLLGVEKSDNPIEIVIHVDMLKEGWDVNNLYTIIPLRTASSKILREQMVGRGLRLPYGVRTGQKYIDAVMLTAHGKFEDILSEAKKGDSIFKAGNVIYVEEIQESNQTVVQLNLGLDLEEDIEKRLEENNLEKTEENRNIIKKVRKIVHENTNKEYARLDSQDSSFDISKISEESIKSIKEDEDLGVIYEENEGIFKKLVYEETKDKIKKIYDNIIPIPKLKIIDKGITEYKFVDFNLDLSKMNYTPIDSKIILQNLGDFSDREIIQGDLINFEVINPAKEILNELNKKSEIDYENCKELLFKLINQFISHYTNLYKNEGMKNIVMMNKKSIASEIHRQMLLEEHFYYSSGLFDEEIIELSKNYSHRVINCIYEKNIYDNYEGNIVNVKFNGIEKSVFSEVKFHSLPELKFARLLEYDKDVIRWLRPNASDFNLFYNKNKKYEPDFVVETEDLIYLVEIKGEDKLENADVLAKMDRAKKYCKVASEYSKVNGYKEWRYLFIPSKEVKENISFENLIKKFILF